MISKNQIKLIIIVIIIAIVTVNTKYFNSLNRLYKIINKIPLTAMMIFTLLATLGIKVYNPFNWSNKELNINEILDTCQQNNINDIPSLNKNEILDTCQQNNINDISSLNKNEIFYFNTNSLGNQRIKHKRKVSESTKKIVAARQKWTCDLCGQLLDETYEVDHVIPLYKGGTNSISNLMALDPICHRKKTNADRLNIPTKVYFNNL